MKNQKKEDIKQTQVDMKNNQLKILEMKLLK